MPFIAAVTLIVIVLGAIVYFALTGEDTGEDQAVRAVYTYVGTFNDGEWDKLGTLSCGDTAKTLESASEEQWQRNRSDMIQRGDLPLVVENLESVVVEGDNATARVIQSPESDKDRKSTAEYTLHRVDGAWKVCRVSSVPNGT